MAVGNSIGFKFTDLDNLFLPLYGSILAEVKEGADLSKLNYRVIGETIEEEEIILGDEKIEIKDIISNYTKGLDQVFPTGERLESEKLPLKEGDFEGLDEKIEKPRVLIPIFTGTHGEYDMARSFEKAGGEVECYVFKTLNIKEIEDSYKEFARKIDEANILAFPDGAILGDEPEGGGKLVKNILQDSLVKEAVMKLVDERKGLVLGIGEGFKGLVRSGLLPLGKIVDHNSQMSIVDNKDGFHKSTIEEVRVVSTKSPWFSYKELGEKYSLPLSTSEGRIVVEEDELKKLVENGQILSQFTVSNTGNKYGIEAVTSKCGRILGKLGSSERLDKGLYKNIGDFEEDNIFQAGIDYFRK